MVDAQYNGQVVGLMGNFDGNSTNDFILPNGTTLDADDVKSERQIYNNFGQLCKFLFLILIGLIMVIRFPFQT